MTKDEFAVLYVQEEMIFRLAEQVGFKGRLAKLNREWSIKVEKLIPTVEDAYTHSISGYFKDNAPRDASCYDIEQDLIKKFGENNFMCDSSGGQLIVNTKANIVDEVFKYLKDNYKYLRLYMDTESARIFMNWDDGKKYCQERGIEVKLPDVVTTDLWDEVEEVLRLKSEVTKAQEKLNNYINSL